MFERFTDDARRVVFEARGLAVARGDDRIGPLHMLSALTTGDGVAARVLTGYHVDKAAVARLLGPGAGVASSTEAAADADALASIGIDLDEIRRKVEESFGAGALDQLPAGKRGSPGLRGHSALTDDAKTVLAMSLKEALALHHNYIGTEHLLLGLLRTADPDRNRGRGRFGLRQALTSLGLSYLAVKDQVLALLATA
jgi:ATP-dependent Clp protease ATP-binding subunit ClpA